MIESSLVFGIILGALFAGLAYFTGALSLTGAIAATLTGGLIFGLGGWAWAILLLTFFFSSSALSIAFRSRKEALTEKFSKGSRRDWGQVLANGGLGALLALSLTLWPAGSGESLPWQWIAFVGAMATVNADTWATELGVLSRPLPRLITTGKRVERGTSGGVTLLGSAAGLGGASLIGILAGLFSPAYPVLILVVATLSGLAGSLIDSWLGASVQSTYYCSACRKETERHPLHSCGNTTSPLRGWRWMDNDWVNWIGSVFGALLAVGLFALLTAG